MAGGATNEDNYSENFPLGQDGVRVYAKWKKAQFEITKSELMWLCQLRYIGHALDYGVE